jgi:ferrous iron transport protein A
MTSTNSARRQRDRGRAKDRADTRTLADLRPGARATVSGVATPSPAADRRLADLGFTAGAVVQVVRQAPLRDPVIYRVKDYEVCLRRAQAACVHVAVVDR